MTQCIPRRGPALILSQTVGKLKEDYVVWGFANLLQEAYQLLQASRSDVPTRSVNGIHPCL
jgi:hypothetical protein